MNPSDVGALLSAGRAHDALAAARRGASAHPSHPQWLLLLGASLHATGASGEAATTLRQAVEADARNPAAWNALGAVLIHLGDASRGEQALREALQLDPAYFEARFNLALALKQRGEFGAARAELEGLVASEPRSELARFELASVLVAEGEAQAALDLLEALRANHPRDARIVANIAAAQARLGRAEAAATCESALAMPTVSASDAAAVAHTLALLGKLPEARAAARRATAMAPATAEVTRACRDAWQRIGVAAAEARDWQAARDAFERQVELAPADPQALRRLAGALIETGELDEAIRVLDRALETNPANARMLSMIVKAKGMACDWDGMDALVARLREAAVASEGDPADPQTALHVSEIGAAEQRAWAERWARAKLPRREPLHARRGAAGGRRLRIGYLSSDFWNHATSFLMVGLLEHHDRDRFEVFAYSTGREDDSEARRRIEASVDRFVPLGAAPAEEAARRVAEDHLDILFDLGGYVKDSRIDILAWRPARVQGHFLGYPGTTGTDFIDVLVADETVVPRGRERDFSERVLRLPACYQPNDPRRIDPPPAPRAALGFAEDAIVLCSFNQAIKIRPQVFARWCELLEALPKALLWLSDPGESARARLRRFAGMRGLDPARIVFAPMAPQHEHIARLRSADIALDTFPYGSHTTASDAVWAGVPLVALSGETFASRVSTSVLRAAGCGDWAFEDPARAFEATLALARDARLREEAHARLASARSSALFDAAGFARDFEALIERALEETA